MVFKMTAEESTYNKVFNKEFVGSKEKEGFRLVGMYANHTPAISISGAFADPNYRWSTTTLLDDESKRYSLPNMAIITGPTYLVDESGNKHQYILNVFDNDCLEMYNYFSIPINQILADTSWPWVTDKVTRLLKEFLAEKGIVNSDYEKSLLDVIKQSGYVTKTRKEYGFHVPYLDSNQRPAIKPGDCKEGKEFEIHTGKHLCTLPGSSYRPPKPGEEGENQDPNNYDSNFRYTQVGRDDHVIVSSVFYDLVCAIGETECLKNSKLDGSGLLNKNNNYSNSDAGYSNSSSNSNSSGSSSSSSNLSDELRDMTTLLMINNSVVIPEHHRHDTLRSVACSILFKHLEAKSNAELKAFFVQVNRQACSPAPQPDSDVERIWKDATEYVSNSKSNTNKKKITREDIAFVFKTMKKEAPYDETAIKQIFYGLCSAFTKKPIHHNINSKKTGSGKNYLLELVSRPFPRKHISELAGVSDKGFVHEEGAQVVVNEDTEETTPIGPIIDNLEKSIKTCKIELKKLNASSNSISKSKTSASASKTSAQSSAEEAEAKASVETEEEEGRKEGELQDKIDDYLKQIEEICARSQKLIDLSNRIILILDTAPEGLFSVLMSVISQDTPRDQIYQFTDKKGSGKLSATKNRLRGTPCMFTTQVIDDTRQSRYQEKNRRFVHVTPNTSAKKIDAALGLIGCRYGSIPEEYASLVVSREDKELVKEIVGILVNKLINHSKRLTQGESGVKIFYHDAIVHSLSSKVVDSNEWAMTVMDRLMRYLTIITRVNMDSRPKLVDTETEISYPISTFEDLKETLQLMGMASSALRPYIANWYNDVFLPTFKNRDRDHGDGNKSEVKTENDKTVMLDPDGLTTKQLADATKNIMNVSARPSNEDILKHYLYPLLNQGVINREKRIMNLNENIWSPAEEGNVFSMFSGEDFRHKINDNAFYPGKSFLEESSRFFVEHRSRQGGILEKNNDGTDTSLLTLMAMKYPMKH